MAVVAINSDQPTKVRREAGQSVTLNNQSAVDVYYDSDIAVLMPFAAGVAPTGGTKLAANSSKDIAAWPKSGVLYFRAAQAITILVEP